MIELLEWFWAPACQATPLVVVVGAVVLWLWGQASEQVAERDQRNAQIRRTSPPQNCPDLPCPYAKCVAMNDPDALYCHLCGGPIQYLDGEHVVAPEFDEFGVRWPRDEVMMEFHRWRCETVGGREQTDSMKDWAQYERFRRLARQKRQVKEGRRRREETRGRI